MKFIYLFVGLLTGISIVRILFDFPFFRGLLLTTFNEEATAAITCLSRALELSCDWLSKNDVFLVEATRKYPELNYLYKVRDKSYFHTYCINKAKESLLKENQQTNNLR